MAADKEKNIDDVLANLSDGGNYLELTALLSKWQLDIRKVRNVIASTSEAKPFLNELETILSRLTEDVELKSELFNDMQLKSDEDELEPKSENTGKSKEPGVEINIESEENSESSQSTNQDI